MRVQRDGVRVRRDGERQNVHDDGTWVRDGPAGRAGDLGARWAGMGRQQQQQQLFVVSEQVVSEQEGRSGSGSV